MGLKIDRGIIADGVGFTEIIDPKLRTSVLKIKFVTELSEKASQLNSIVSLLVPASNSRIKTYSEMSDRLDALYGSSLYSDTNKNGDCQTVTISADCINNRFAFDGEDILGELLDIINDCIFSPNIDGDGFDKTEFELKRRELIESICSDINNKRWYAMLRAQKNIFVGEPGEISVYGKVETAEKITPREAYEAYQWLLKTAVIEIYFVSPEEDHSDRPDYRNWQNSDRISRRSCRRPQVTGAPPQSHPMSLQGMLPEAQLHTMRLQRMRYTIPTSTRP